MELTKIAYEIEKAISKREIQNVAVATGPKLWTRVLGLDETNTVAYLEWSEMKRDFIKNSKYPSNTSKTELSWKKMQLRMSIYQYPPEAVNEL